MARSTTSKTKSTKSVKSTTRKTTATTRAAAPKAVKVTPVPAPATASLGVTAEVPGIDALRKRDLINDVVIKSGIKKKFAKPVVEAMLVALGEAIADGRPLNLPPMGKLKVTKEKETPNAKIVTCRIRQSNRANNTPNDPLAEAAE